MDRADNTVAEPQETEGDAEPEVRQSTRTNKGVPPRLSYLTKTDAVTEPSTWEDIERMSTRQTEKWRKAAEEEIGSFSHRTTSRKEGSRRQMDLQKQI